MSASDRELLVEILERLRALEAKLEEPRPRRRRPAPRRPPVDAAEAREIAIARLRRAGVLDS